MNKQPFPVKTPTIPVKKGRRVISTQNNNFIYKKVLKTYRRNAGLKNYGIEAGG